MPSADFFEGIGKFTTLSPIPAHGKKKFFYLVSEKHLAVSNIVYTFAVYYNAITQKHLSEVCDFLLEIRGFLLETQGFLLEIRGFSPRITGFSL